MRNRKKQSQKDRKNRHATAKRAELHASIDKTGGKMFTYSHAEMRRKFKGFNEPVEYDENGVEKRYVVFGHSRRIIPDFGAET